MRHDKTEGTVVQHPGRHAEFTFRDAGDWRDPGLKGCNRNLAGRVEINAFTTLDLTETRITALAYLLLKATNHFKGSAGAYIQSPNLDVLLRSTNGVLSSTNLVLPYIDSLFGSVSVDSTRWFEVDAAGVTNWFHVLFVDT